MSKESGKMRIELNTDADFEGMDFWRGTTCAVCGYAIENPPALWIALESSTLDYFLHKHSEPGFNADVVKRRLGDLVIVCQKDLELHDAPPERN
jgi:hypothetical protein